MSARIEPKIEWKEIIELVWIVHAWVRPRGSPVRAHKWKGNLPLVEQAKHPHTCTNNRPLMYTHTQRYTHTTYIEPHAHTHTQFLFVFSKSKKATNHALKQQR